MIGYKEVIPLSSFITLLINRKYPLSRLVFRKKSDKYTGTTGTARVGTFKNEFL